MTQPPPPPASSSEQEDASRRWKTWQLAITTGMALIVGLVLGGVGSDGTDEGSTASEDASELEDEIERLQTEIDERDQALAEAAERAEERFEGNEDEAQASDATADNAEGSEEDASSSLAIGETGMIGDYEVSVTDFTADDTAAVLAANEFNDDPENGVYATVTFDATYTGDGDGMPGFDLSAALVIDGVQHGDTGCGAVVEDDAINAPTLEDGGTAEGLAFCFDHPGLNETAELFFEETLSFDDARIYWDVD